MFRQSDYSTRLSVQYLLRVIAAPSETDLCSSLVVDVRNKQLSPSTPKLTQDHSVMSASLSLTKRKSIYVTCSVEHGSGGTTKSSRYRVLSKSENGRGVFLRVLDQTKFSCVKPLASTLSTFSSVRIYARILLKDVNGKLCGPSDIPMSRLCTFHSAPQWPYMEQTHLHPPAIYRWCE